MTERKRSGKGTFVADQELRNAEPPAAGGQSPVREVKAPRPKYCRVFVRARMAEALPAIVATLIERAKAGSVPHMSLLLKTAGLDQKGEIVPRAMQRPGKSLEAILMDGWRQGPAE
jgi:hypothetical protein